MGAYIVKCGEIITDNNGNVTEIHCTADLESGCGMPADGRKIKGTIHWISACHADFMNENSVVTLTGCKAEPSLITDENTHFQFVRTGYFVRDCKTPNVYNRTVSLKDSFKP